MTRKEAIYDIKEILTKSNITDDSRLDDDYIGHLLDQKRAKEIRDTFKRQPVIEPIWLQDMGTVNLTPVNVAEDRNISFCECALSKAVIPPVVSIADPMGNIPDLGVYSIRSVCGKYEYFYKNVAQMGWLTHDSILSKFRYYTRVYNSIYLPNDIEKIRMLLILESPLDGYILENTYVTSGNLVVGITYLVTSGNVTHNSVVVFNGSTFVAANTTFTGSGKVKLDTQKRAMTNDDEYPMSSTMAEVVKMKIWTQDYGIEQQVIDDARNDSKDQS